MFLIVTHTHTHTKEKKDGKGKGKLSAFHFSVTSIPKKIGMTRVTQSLPESKKTVQKWPKRKAVLQNISLQNAGRTLLTSGTSQWAKPLFHSPWGCVEQCVLLQCYYWVRFTHLAILNAFLGNLQICTVTLKFNAFAVGSIIFIIVTHTYSASSVFVTINSKEFCNLYL